ncbi:hypothetical protein GW17_00041213, partial [Ensete ventricosum]
ITARGTAASTPASAAASLALSSNHCCALLSLTPLPPPSPSLGHRPATTANRCAAMLMASPTAASSSLPCGSPRQPQPSPPLQSPQPTPSVALLCYLSKPLLYCVVAIPSACSFQPCLLQQQPQPNLIFLFATEIPTWLASALTLLLNSSRNCLYCSRTHMSLAIAATPHRTLFLPCHYFRCYPRYSSTSPLLPIAPLPIKRLQPIHRRCFLLGAVVSNIAPLLPSPYSFPCHLAAATSTLLFIYSIVTATLPPSLPVAL